MSAIVHLHGPPRPTAAPASSPLPPEPRTLRLLARVLALFTGVRAHRELAALSDHALCDIGLERADVDDPLAALRRWSERERAGWIATPPRCGRR